MDRNGKFLPIYSFEIVLGPTNLNLVYLFERIGPSIGEKRRKSFPKNSVYSIFMQKLAK